MGKPWVVLLIAFVVGCATMDIPQAHRGRLFDRTGAWAFYAGGKGFTGPVLGPGTYYTGAYDELMMVDCSTITEHDPMAVLTKDGVQFGLDMYVRFSANCSDDSVKQLLSSLSPDQPHVISVQRLFATYVRPAIQSVVREVIAPYRANEINDQHHDIVARIRKRFMEVIESHEGHLIKVYEVTLSNLDFPEAMDTANVDRAVQTILRDKAIAARERVKAEIETMVLRRDLAEKEGAAEAARIDAVGEALERNPDFLRYDLQSKMPEIYAAAGARGNMIITAPQPTVLVQPRPPAPTAPAPRRGR
jgi:regulator of protease activity HflC (stomatin/prohibitin superfamily)